MRYVYSQPDDVLESPRSLGPGGAWQKQEVLKGIDLLFGTLDGGWGFHCWRRTVGHNMHRTVHYLRRRTHGSPSQKCNGLAR